MARSMLVAGDFNVHFGTVDNRVAPLCDALGGYGLHHLFQAATRQGVCLDNVFVSPHINVLSSLVVQPNISDHDGQQVDFSVPTSRSLIHTKKICRPVTQHGLFNFHNIISDTPWHFVSEPNILVEEKFITFLNILEDTCLKCFPIKQFTVRSDQSNNISWFSDELRGMRERLRFLELVSKQYTDVYHKNVFLQYRNKYNKAIKVAKIKANDRLIQSSSNPGRTMWQVINKSCGNKTGRVRDCSLTANDFNNFFLGVGQGIMSGMPISNIDPISLIPKHDIVFSFNEVSYNKVRDIISSLKNKNSKDIFGLNVKILKSITNEIIVPLTNLINLCLKESCFPSVLKEALVIPLFKKGDCNKPDNYRPISLLPIVSKILERCLAEQIADFFKKNNLFSKCQFGFRKDKSTVLGVLDLVSDILEGFQNFQYDTVLCCDLSKAFDCVDHGILLGKLKAYNFNPSSIQLMKSYLEGRCQSVSFAGVASAIGDITMDVPQGSILGPILFLIYINDLPLISEYAKFTLFADDTTVSFRADTLGASLEGSLVAREGVESWFCSNRLLMNSDKTLKIIFSMRELGQVESADTTKFLGVTLDQRLHWGHHINQLTLKLNKAAYLIRGLSDRVSAAVLRTAYFGVFHSHLSYSILAWGHASDTKRVFGIQRRVIRVLAGLAYREDCKAAFKQLGILTLPSVYILENLLYVKRNTQSFTTHQDIHGYNTRHRTDFVPPYCRLERCRDGPGFWGIKLFIALPSEIKYLPLNSFKTKIKKVLLVNAFYSLEEFFNHIF
ncbi:uncharacterized protein LOC126734556 [Anthonomus grandis grandis]|uniref:uncharacterized protein LOC126734556 n=1 Tax=Anthonomus grandis grandis TaxID=2921223 RepID=UPI0021663C40|nr:uncharacterized protein LOC126734556 [Anthonomus grandis grandis]